MESKPSGSVASTQEVSPIEPADATWREVQLRYRLAPPSFKNLLSISHAPSRHDILRQASFCTELLAFPFKSTDKSFFREINDHCPIPYRIPEALTQPWQKVFLLVQVDLARCGWPNKLSSAARKELHSERGRIYRFLDQALRCLVDILGQRLDGTGVIAALDVLRSVAAGIWEGNDMDLLQVQGIGPAKAQKLMAAGVKTIRQLAKLEFWHIERLVSRNPPYGQQLLRQIAGFPRLEVSASPVELPPDDGKTSSVQLPVLRITLRYDNEELPVWNKRSPWTTLVVSGENGHLLWFWRGSVKKLNGGKDILVRLRANCHETVKVDFSCECIVGTMQRIMVQI